MAKQWFYKINPEKKTVERYDELDNLVGSLSFDDIRSLRKNPRRMDYPEVYALYLIAYDELIDRGLIKEEE